MKWETVDVHRIDAGDPLQDAVDFAEREGLTEAEALEGEGVEQCGARRRGDFLGHVRGVDAEGRRHHDRHRDEVGQEQGVVGIALGVEAGVNAAEIGVREELAPLGGDGEVDGAGLAVPHPGGERLGDLAGGAHQVLEVAQRDGPAEGAHGGRRVLTGLLERFGVRASGGGDGVARRT